MMDIKKTQELGIKITDVQNLFVKLNGNHAGACGYFNALLWSSMTGVMTADELEARIDKKIEELTSKLAELEALNS